MPVLSDCAIQALSEEELNAQLHALMVVPGLSLLRRDADLPYCFDLIHDIKEWWEVDNILKGEPHCSGLDADDLRNFAAEQGYLLDQPAVGSFTSDWGASGKVLAELYAHNDLSVTAIAGRVWSSCKDAKGCFHNFKDTNPLVAAMRCALAVYQAKG